MRGSCQCGDIRFEIAGAFDAFFLCHCSRCRKDTGSAHGANLFSSSAGINWLSGEEAVRTYTVPGTRHARSFCPTCGAAVPRVEEGTLVVPAGSLDSPLTMHPTAHICGADRAEWDRHLEAVPTWDGLPGQ